MRTFCHGCRFMQWPGHVCSGEPPPSIDPVRASALDERDRRRGPGGLILVPFSGEILAGGSSILFARVQVTLRPRRLVCETAEGFALLDLRKGKTSSFATTGEIDCANFPAGARPGYVPRDNLLGFPVVVVGEELYLLVRNMAGQARRFSAYIEAECARSEW